MSVALLMPVGRWIRLELPGHPPMNCFTYVDPSAGLSAHGFPTDQTANEKSSLAIIRLPIPGVPWELLGSDEIQRLGLETPPGWVAEFYGPQPPNGMLWGGWREHPKLKGRFLPDHPDDLQVFVHDGGPRISSHPAELVWVSVTEIDGDLFRGRVLNQPHKLKSVKAGSPIRFMMPDGAPHPIMVTEKYLRERVGWRIHPCQKCGLSELFDAPSDLIRVVFPNQPKDVVMSMFTAFCPLCRGVQGVELLGESLPTETSDTPVQSAKRPWWKFW